MTSSSVIMMEEIRYQHSKSFDESFYENGDKFYGGRTTDLFRYNSNMVALTTYIFHSFQAWMFWKRKRI